MMTTKEKLLGLLEENRGCYFSGEEIARALCVSRTAVWKAVKALQSEGYTIDAVTNRGYCLSAETDILSLQGMEKYLEPDHRELSIHVLPTAVSTNALVREAAENKAPEGYTVIAGEQTEGRGRYGRRFFSPPDTGIYLSILLRSAHYTARQAVRITTMAAVAMCEAIEEVSGEQAAIKWVNDLYVRGKKVCGILTEASFSLENGELEYIVLGVGVNVYPPENGFPAELSAVAGAVADQPRGDLKNRLAAAFLNRVLWYYRLRDRSDYIGSYRSRSFVVGKQVTVSLPGQSRSGLARGIDDECRLIVEYDGGETASLSYGEIEVQF